MQRPITKIAVIGSGVMGSGIAAHFANAGLDVLLLDVKGKGFGKKNHLAEDAIDRLLKTDPAPLMHPSFAKKITAGNIEDDLSKIKDCHWVVEAIVEQIDIKRALYAQIESHIQDGTIVSSNTSTIPLDQLTAGRGERFQRHFLITHFFNPPRYMRLIEIVKGQKTDGGILSTVTDFADRVLGKGAVMCNDTPGFIANRIGTFWLQIAVLEAIERGISVEDADAVFGRPMGIPKTGVFGLLDLVGLDLMPLIGKSMCASLPETDAYRQLYQEPAVIQKMIADGYTGRKGKGGFYRLNRDDGNKIKESIDLQTGHYAKTQKSHLACLDVGKKDLRALLSHPDKGAQYAWSVLSQVLCYTASLVPEIADSIHAVDTAMKLGYNWKYGPFELIDRLGASWFVDRLKSEGRPIPALVSRVGNGTFYRVENGQTMVMAPDGSYNGVIRAPGILLLSDIKLSAKPILKNPSASLWDVGDGVCCLEFHGKMNSLDSDVFILIQKTIDLFSRNPETYKALVVYNEGSHFSAGANLGLALFAANLGLWDQIELLVETGQKTYKALKYAPFPVVGAPSGMALGGGCEVLLHCDAIQAHAETYGGLVEVGVGVVPAWGGCKEMLMRHLNAKNRAGGTMIATGKVFEMIGTAKVAKSAMEARDLLILRDGDGITMNRDRLLFDAKQKALALVSGGYTPPVEQTVSLSGAGGRVAFSMAVKALVKTGKATPYDEEVAKRLAYVLSGGNADSSDTLTEDDILGLEREMFMKCARDPRTWARMEHILETGKPLRN